MPGPICDEIMLRVPHQADDEMASPALLHHLARAVAARQHLNDAGAALELERE